MSLAHSSVALYFCQHGHLWLLDVTTWTNHAEFYEMERWFFTRAKEVFGEAGQAMRTRIRR
jgi:hypothetical protein